MRMLTAFSALRAGKVFPADSISVIASCREDADIIAGALKLLKDDPENCRHYQLVTENVRMILLSRKRHLPPFVSGTIKSNWCCDTIYLREQHL